MNKKIIPLILAGTGLLVGCNDATRTSSASNDGRAVAVISKEDAIAVVNGQYISKTSLTTLEKEISQRAKGQSFPKEKLLEELIQRELLIQEAIQKQLHKSPEYTERLQSIINSLLSQTAIQNYLDSNPVTDAELNAEYQKKVTESGTEYKARHILVKTEEEAKLIIEELKKGTDFVTLAKSKSTGPSGPQGGDLGWFTAGQMVAPFSEAAIALEDGKFTLEPVQTQFGWHVILKEQSRTQTPPPFESVKEQIRPALQRQKLQSFLETLRKQAKVEILSPATEEKTKADTAIAPVKAPDSAINKAVEATSEDAKKAEKVAAEVKSETTKTTEQAKEVIVDTKDKALEAVKSVVEDAKSVANKAVEEKTSETVENATKKLEEVTEY